MEDWRPWSSCACARDVGLLSPGLDVGLAQLCVLRRLGLKFMGLNLGSHPFTFAFLHQLDFLYIS